MPTIISFSYQIENGMVNLRSGDVMKVKAFLDALTAAGFSYTKNENTITVTGYHQKETNKVISK